MVRGLALFVFLHGLVCTWAGFVLSPSEKQPLASGHEDARLRARAMAEDLLEALPLDRELPQQLEPAIDQTREDSKAQESRSELLAATSLFNAAASDSTEEQQAVEAALRDAMSSPSRVGKPDRSTTANYPTACLPDLTQCPVDWHRKGALCVASAAYAGRCAAEADFSEMSIEQKMAFANLCSVAFPCQESCAQDFGLSCPSLWREIAPGLCSAPLNYEGNCATRLNVAAMTEEEKYSWAARCGARWPCAGAARRNYENICPEGWSMQFGKVCAAPSSYNGPCEHTAYMGAASVADKKAFEATCHVEWPAAGGECIHDFSAVCPFGWARDGDICLAPAGFNSCSTQKSFRGMTPAAKQDWAQNCGVRFPCQGRL